MATSNLHIELALLSGYTLEEAVVLTTPDSVRCWSGPRQYTHFTENPATRKISWIKYPEVPVKEWKQELIDSAEKFDAGKPGVAAVDEASNPSIFWNYNQKTNQNELFYAHVVQDVLYDDYLRTYVDTSKMYEDEYLFDGKIYTGDEFRKNGDERWSGESLVNSFNTQVFIAAAKKLYETRGIIANREWFEKEVFPVFYKMYSMELAEKTISFITMTDFADKSISSLEFDYQHGPVPSSDVDKFIELTTDICAVL